MSWRSTPRLESDAARVKLADASSAQRCERLWILSDLGALHGMDAGSLSNRLTHGGHNSGTASPVPCDGQELAASAHFSQHTNSSVGLLREL